VIEHAALKAALRPLTRPRQDDATATARARESAGAALHQAVTEAAIRAKVREKQRDDVVAIATLNVLKRLSGAGGEAWLEEIDSLPAYLTTIAKNTRTDGYRDRGAADEVRRAVKVHGGRDGPSPEDEVIGKQAAESWRRHIEAALELSIAAQRGDAAQTRVAWEQISELATGATTIEMLVAAEWNITAEDPSFVRRRNCVYKRHERARTAVLAGIEQLAARGQISAERAQELIDVVNRMVRATREAPTSRQIAEDHSVLPAGNS
jgi:DNA-directed RNA polymerase specialized sigma24 family protein